MTFESFTNANNSAAVNEGTVAVQEPVVNQEPVIVNDAMDVKEDGLAVKVSYRDELRRATVNANSYVALRDLCARLFELEPATVVLKYQDSDGDKITVSSDAEVQESLQLAKESKILRLFVEVKAPVIAPAAAAEAPRAEAPFGGWGWRRFGGPMRGGFPHRGGFAHHGYPHHRGGPHHGPHGEFSHPHPFPHQGPHGGFHGHHGGPFPTERVHYANASVDPNSNANEQGPSANWNTPHMFGHGTFYPADSVPHHAPFNSPYGRCAAFKARKHEMKEQIKMMKANAVTDEDRKAIKDFKEQMRAECKAQWHDMKSDKKAFKSDWKSEKKAEKMQWKEWKQEKKCGKDERKEWKHEKKCAKDDRLIARHVADVTIPDNSELPADTPVTKTWRLRNAGLQAWPADSQLLFISRRGDNLNGPERIFVGAVPTQQEVEVSVTFITPAAPGRYIGYYRMANGDGVKFGQRVWVSFIIPATATPAAPSAPLLYPTMPPTATTAHAPLAIPQAQEPPKAPSSSDPMNLMD